jgi:hypothetical protein
MDHAKDRTRAKIPPYCSNRDISFDDLAKLYAQLDANQSQTVSQFPRGTGRLVEAFLKNDPAVVDSRAATNPMAVRRKPRSSHVAVEHCFR